MFIASCYASPNKNIENLNRTLQDIALLNLNVTILGGDLNGKAHEWGESREDDRGNLITNWCAANDMMVMNRGNKPTFEVRDKKSIVDITVAGGKIAPKVKKMAS